MNLNGTTSQFAKDKILKKYMLFSKENINVFTTHNSSKITYTKTLYFKQNSSHHAQ